MMLGWNVTRWVGKVRHRAAVHADTSSQPRRPELGYSKTRNRSPSSVSGSRSRGRAPQSSYNGKSEEHSEASSHWIYVSLKACVLLTVSIIVLYFQIKNRPHNSKIYYTNNPHDNHRGGVNYTCGCNLPPSMQDLQNADTTSGQDGRNICYEASSLETVEILMYSESAAEKVKSITPEEPTNKTVSDGYKVYQQAHDILGPINNYSETSVGVISAAGRRLYLGGYRQPDKEVTLDFLESSTFVGFPPAYVRLAFTYWCYNCSLCDLDKVNRIFSTVTGGEEPGWGSCFYYGSENRCNTTLYDLPNYYQAKCMLYPTTSLPANFAVQEFLRHFLRLVRRDWIEALGSGVLENMSIQPSTVFLNSSRYESRNINLSFLEMQWGSALWLSLYKAFPMLEGKCSDIRGINISNGTSVCNVFATSHTTQSYDLKCIHMTNVASHVTEVDSSCLQLMANSTVDNVKNLFPEVGISGINPSMDNYTYLACHPPSNKIVAPYLATWDISSDMTNDSLNVFLHSEILKEEWSQRSGVCINTYQNVIRQKADDGNKTSGFWETNCAWGDHKNGTRVQANAYCWLTGRYHNFNDTPEDPWTNGTLQSPNSTDRHLFVCYRVHRQELFVWFITMFGILFGWVGTCELLFRSAERMLRGLKARQDQRRKEEEQEREIEQLRKETSNTSPSDVEEL